MMKTPCPLNLPPVPAQTTPLIVQSRTQTPLGEVMLAATSQGLAGVWFVQGQAHLPDHSHWPTDHAHPCLRAASQQLLDYLTGERQNFELSIHPAWGTPFQRSVWQALLGIAYGQTRTYGDIARTINKPQAVRAVGAAIGQNPHSVVVPCHRVVGANGSLTGYAGGLARKQQLLALEANRIMRP